MNAPSNLNDISLRLVDLDGTFALHKAVLRPWLTPEEACASWADTPEHFHVAALHGGTVVRTAGFMADAHPDYAEAFGPRVRA